MGKTTMWLRLAFSVMVVLMPGFLGSAGAAGSSPALLASPGIMDSGPAPAGISPTYDWSAESDQGGAQFGRSVASAGDVNGDGYDDVIIGAWQYDGGATDSGRAYLFYGSAGGLSTTPDRILEPPVSDTYGYFGVVVGLAGNVNCDEYDDVMVAMTNYDYWYSDEGAVYVWYGTANGIGASPDWYARGNDTYAHLGWDMGTAGDVNGDGCDDIIAGAYRYDYAGAANAYVWYGSPTGLGDIGIPANADWTASGDQALSAFGTHVGAAGDVNGDGYGDVYVGAPEYDHGESNEGMVFVWYGSDTGLGANGTPANADWTAESDQVDGQLSGRWNSAPPRGGVGSAGDVNGDGYDDFVAGSNLYDNSETDEGALFLWYGSGTGLGDYGTPGNADWRAESNQASAWFSSGAGTAGDVDGDGYDDVLVGACFFDQDGLTNQGLALAWLGSSGGLGENGTPDNADWSARSDQSNSYLGYSLAAAGDVNGDGSGDVIAGAYAYDSPEGEEGRAFAYYGRACQARIAGTTTVYSTIQEAVDTALGGDVIQIAGYCEGTWEREGLTQSVYLTKTVTLEGGYPLDFGDVADPVAYPTTVDAAGKGRALYISGNIEPVIEGLRITGGDAAGQGGAGPDDGGGGIYVITATATISNCWIFGNTAQIGGGVLLGETTGALVDNQIYENSAGDGGGVGTAFASPTIAGNEIYSNTGEYCGGGLNIFETDGTFEDNIVHDNNADEGGGLCVVDSAPAISANQILTNTVAGSGGGLYLEGSPATVSDNTIRDNRAEWEGGGLYIYDSTATLTGNLIRGNDADNDVDAGSGGGLKIEGEGSNGATLTDNEILENTVHWVGAGVFVQGCSPTLTGNWIHHNSGNEGSGITVDQGEAILTGNTIDHNSANWRAGGLALRSATRCALIGNVIRDNDAQWNSGGLMIEGSNPVLINNAILDNQLNEGGAHGSGLYAVDSTLDILLHNTFSGNSGGNGAAFQLAGATGSTATMTNTIISGHTVGVLAESGSVAALDGVLWYGNTDDTAGAGTVTVQHAYDGDPAFATDGYHLLLGSAAIDAGIVTDLTTDIDGDARPLNYGYDLGVDEYDGDLVLPEIVGREPVPGATDVSVEADIVITFSEAVDPGSFAYNVAPDPGGWSVAWGGGNTVVTLSHNSLAMATTYAVTVSAADDVAGNPLAGAPVEWSFTTEQKYSVFLPVMVRNFP